MRSNHVHIVVKTDLAPERAMVQLKSRALNCQAGASESIGGITGARATFGSQRTSMPRLVMLSTSRVPQCLYSSTQIAGSRFRAQNASDGPNLPSRDIIEFDRYSGGAFVRGRLARLFDGLPSAAAWPVTGVLGSVTARRGVPACRSNRPASPWECRGDLEPKGSGG